MFLIAILASMVVFADHDTIPGGDPDSKKPVIKFSGFVKTDFQFDTRLNVGLRAENFLMYPKPVWEDDFGNDLNATPNVHFTPIQTRVAADMSGTKILNADAGAKIEVEFFGVSDSDINGLRLRHAYTFLHWKNGVSVFAGQMWHPMFVELCFPGVASFNTGVPFTPFSRNPQFRFQFKKENFTFVAAALSQIDMTSAGPSGNSLSYLRNSPIPELSGRLMYSKLNAERRRFFMAGTAFSYKKLRPRLYNALNNKVNETMSSASVMAFATYAVSSLNIKTAAVMGQDMSNLLMLGGYAIQHSDYDMLVSIQEQELLYTPITTVSGWIDVSYGEKWQTGIFAGYTQNMGSFKNIWDWTNSSSYFARGWDIHHLYRISPRLAYVQDNVKIGLEGEYTTAAYGSVVNSLSEWSTLTDVSNIRLLLFVVYHF